MHKNVCHTGRFIRLYYYTLIDSYGCIIYNITQADSQGYINLCFRDAQACMPHWQIHKIVNDMLQRDSNRGRRVKGIIYANHIKCTYNCWSTGCNHEFQSSCNATLGQTNIISM